MVGVTGPTLGACVQCTDNTHCEYKVIGSAQGGTMNGSRCVSDSCVEGCDTDADCYPDHVVPTNAPKYCHLGQNGDPNNHKCVQCHCDVVVSDTGGQYCEVLTNGQPACPAGGGGALRVCDATTLNCRPKRFGEQCLNSNECGDPHDPLLDPSCPISALCVYNSDPQPTGSEQYCAADHASYGRCGVHCDSLVDNKYCGDTLACPASSQCRPARDGASVADSQCVPATCSNP